MHQILFSDFQSFIAWMQVPSVPKLGLPLRLINTLIMAVLLTGAVGYWTSADAATQPAIVLQAASEISGNAFADYNADGVDAGPNEHGISGILVQAFDADNNAIGEPVATDANGNYTVSGLADGQQVRLEFTLPPSLAFMRPGAADLMGSDAGSGSTVILATAGDVNVNVSFNNPADYCQANPDVAISCFVSGAVDGPNAADPAMVTIPFEAEGREQNQTTKLNLHQDVGTVYGIAYQKTTERLYAAAYLKRFTDFGPGGPDAIYQVDLTGAVVGTMNLSELTGTTNVAGADPHDFTLDPVIDEVRDDAAYSLIGKSSFGDIELSDDMSTLYVVNMADRKIYAVDVSTGDIGAATVVNSWDAPDACGNGSHRPMGLAWRNEKLWVGSVCDDLSGAHVHSLDPTGTTFDLEVTIPLDYPREQVLNVPGLSEDTLSTWNAWSDDPTLFDYSFITTIEFEITYPQPMLSDIEFDGPHMILGLRDRFGDQTGYQAAHVPAGSGTSEAPDDRLYDADAVGDILRVCSDGAGGWIVETGVSGDCAPDAGAIGPQPDSGPSGGEYYYWDNYPSEALAAPWTPNENIEHYETSQGSLLQVQGSPSIMLTAMDPFRPFSAGVLRLDNLTGQRIGISPDDILDDDELDAGAYQLYNVDDQPSTFGKANGLGDLEAICRLAPLEIGNYVWLDTDGDGIQDPDETGISGVTVELYQDGTLVGTTTTNENGQYIFGGIDDIGMTNGTLLPNTTYQIRIALDDQALPADAQPTTQDYNSNADNGDLHDADGDKGALNTGFSTIELTTAGPGENDHTFDFGFSTVAPQADIQIEKTVYLGHDDGASCPGNELATGTVGAQVTYCFVVTNTGDTYLNAITIDDATLSITRADMTQTSGTEPLAPNATLTFYFETTLAGPLVNTASTSGTPTDADGNPIPGLDNPTDEDDAEVDTLEELAAIGDFVWLDTNADGIQDPGELGLPGINVILYDESGSEIAETITDNQGKYLFDDLQPGTYSIGFELPSTMYAISPQDVVDTTDELDNDADPISGRTEPTELTAGEVDLTWDAGIYGLPELTISKESDLTVVQPGGKIVYTIKYANTGIGRANNVIVTENVPRYTRFVAEESSPFICMNDGAVGGSICTYNVGTIPAPSSGTFELTFVVVADTAIPENIKIIENVVSIDDGGPAGLNVDGVVIQIKRPTSVDLIAEPSVSFPTTLYVPMIQ